jgi:hypothetical protein
MKRRAWALALAVCCLTLLLNGTAAAQDAAAFDPARVPAEGAKEREFVPAGWKVDGRAEGDLNGDGRADTVLRLVPGDYDSSGIAARGWRRSCW